MFMFEMPEEMQAAMQRHQEMSEMDQTEKSHNFYRFIEELDQDSIKSLKYIVQAIINSDGAAGHYLIGVLNSRLMKDFNICLSCGVNHDEQLADLFGAADTADTELDLSARGAVLDADGVVHLTETKSPISPDTMCGDNFAEWAVFQWTMPPATTENIADLVCPMCLHAAT